MSKLIIPGSEPLIDPAYDKFLDGHPTRRELQETFARIGRNMTQFWEGLDTQALVGNFLCEKHGVTREEIDAYVEKKALEIKAQIEAQKKQGEATQNAVTNS